MSHEPSPFGVSRNAVPPTQWWSHLDVAIEDGQLQMIISNEGFNVLVMFGTWFGKDNGSNIMKYWYSLSISITCNGFNIFRYIHQTWFVIIHYTSTITVSPSWHTTSTIAHRWGRNSTALESRTMMGALMSMVKHCWQSRNYENSESLITTNYGQKLGLSMVYPYKLEADWWFPHYKWP